MGHIGTRLLAGLVVTGTLALGGCGGSGVHTGMDVSWAGSASSLPDLTRQADAVVEAQVASVADTGIHPASGGDGYPYTDFNVDVANWLKGTGGSSIVVHQTGGPDASGATVTVSDDPLLQVGDEAVLFLHEYEPGHYAILWGPTGRFPVQHGQVVAMPGADVTAGLPENVSAFASQVRAATGPSGS